MRFLLRCLIALFLILAGARPAAAALLTVGQMVDSLQHMKTAFDAGAMPNKATGKLPFKAEDEEVFHFVDGTWQMYLGQRSTVTLCEVSALLVS